MSNLYLGQGRKAEAERLCQQALELRKRILGKLHHDTIKSLMGLVAIYFSQERIKEAIELRGQLIELTQDINAYGIEAIQQEQYVEAEALLTQALEVMQLYFEGQPAVAQVFGNLAILYEKQGRYEEAESYYWKALELKNQIFSTHTDIPITASAASISKTLCDLADFYSKLEHYSESESLYLQALAICQQQLGLDHPNTIKIRSNLQALREVMEN